MNKIHAPFTDEQCAALNRWQASNFVHPFTCGSDNRSDEAHLAVHKPGEDFGQLVATPAGWVCPGCDYRQDWAFEEMLHEPVDLLEQLADSMNAKPK